MAIILCHHHSLAKLWLYFIILVIWPHNSSHLVHPIFDSTKTYITKMAKRPKSCHWKFWSWKYRVRIYSKFYFIYEFFSQFSLESLVTLGSSSKLKNEPILKLQIALESQWSKIQLEHNKWKMNKFKLYNNLDSFHKLSTIS